MAAPKMIFSHLRRSRHFTILSTLSLLNRPSTPNPSAPLSSAFQFLRPFSTRPNDVVHHHFFSTSSTDPPSLGVDNFDSILPVRVLISVLDGYHDLTGLPWWLVIVSSTVAMRVALYPLLVLQLKKLKTLGDLLPKLPPPFPPPESGRSFADQFLLYLKEKHAIGCPSFFWFVAHFSVQVPLFFLWLTSIRQMSLNHHPGFDSGGSLWFQNLTEFPTGAFGAIFPCLIAMLHYASVQLSFEKSSLERLTRIFGSLARFYKKYLDLMALPLIFIGFNIPEGSLVYWVTNSSLTIAQQLSLRHPTIRAKLGLPNKDSPVSTEKSQEIIPPELMSMDSTGKFHKVSGEDLSPKQLLQLSVQVIASGNREAGISLLQQAIEKDPDHVEALIVMGQVLLQEGHPIESAKLLEHAISKLDTSHPSNLYLLILAYQWAGVASVQQGKKAEGILHLKRVASYEEPEDPRSKAHYFDSLVLLASALHDEGLLDEAAIYLDLAVAYNPAYKELFERCATDQTDVVSALVNSRRGDY